MKKAIMLLIIAMLTLSLETMAMADGNTTVTALDAGLYFDLGDADNKINGSELNTIGFKGYRYWADTFFHINKPINNNIHTGAVVKLELSTGGSGVIMDLAPYVKWTYKPWVITIGTKQGQQAGWSEDFDGSWWALRERLKAPGIDINYEIMNGFNYYTVITSPEGYGEARYNVLSKFIYDRNGFRLGGGYQTDQRDRQNDTNYGYWDAFTGFSLGEIKVDAEYQHRDFQLSDNGYTNDDSQKTSALLVNATYKSYPITYKLRYWQAYEPGFTTIWLWHADPERLYFESMDYDYNMYDRVRKYGIESQIAGLNLEYKFSNKRRLEAEFYYGMELGKKNDNPTDIADGLADEISGEDTIGYKLSFENKVSPNFTTTYTYKVLDDAYQYNAKLDYKWAEGFRTNLEVGYGKTQDDVKNHRDDGFKWIARMLVNYL